MFFLYTNKGNKPYKIYFIRSSVNRNDNIVKFLNTTLYNIEFQEHIYEIGYV